MTQRDLDQELRSLLHERVDGQDVGLAAVLAAFPDRVDRQRRRRRAVVALSAAVLAAVAVTLPSLESDRRASPPADERIDEVRTVTPSGTTAIGLGGKPRRLAVAGGTVWAALDDGGLVRVDPVSGRVTTVAELPSSLFDVEVGGSLVWVSAPYDHQVLGVDPATGRVVHTVRTSAPGPRGMALAGDSLWVASGADLLEVDAASGEVRRTVSLPGVTSAYDLAVTDDAVWVTDERGTAVSRVPLAGGAVRRVPVGAGSTGVAAGGGSVWVALVATNRMVRLDERSGAVLSRPSLPFPGLAVSAVGSSVWVGVPDADLVVSFDARSGRQTRRWSVGDFPPYVVGDGSAVFVSSYKSGQVVRVPLDQR